MLAKDGFRQLCRPCSRRWRRNRKPHGSCRQAKFQRRPIVRPQAGKCSHPHLCGTTPRGRLLGKRARALQRSSGIAPASLIGREAITVKIHRWEHNLLRHQPQGHRQWLTQRSDQHWPEEEPPTKLGPLQSMWRLRRVTCSKTLRRSRYHHPM